MDEIKVLRNTGASGKSLVAGKTYKVPAEVSEKDAGILIRMRKAEEVKAEVETPEGPREPKDMTKAEISEELAGFEVPHSLDEKKDDLIILLHDARAKAAAG